MYEACKYDTEFHYYVNEDVESIHPSFSARGLSREWKKSIIGLIPSSASHSHMYMAFHGFATSAPIHVCTYIVHCTV